MASFEKRCRESIEQFGGSFEEVHKGVDEYAGSSEYRFRNRSKMHDEEGIQPVVELFGEEAGRVARMLFLISKRKGGRGRQICERREGLYKNGPL